MLSAPGTQRLRPDDVHHRQKEAPAVAKRRWPALLSLGLLLALAACTPGAGPAPATPTPAGSPAAGEPAGEVLLYPPAFVQYQAYLDAIGARPGPAERATVEATVLSLRRDEVCPYPVEGACPIEPYPRDGATVRVERIEGHIPPSAATTPGEGSQGGSSGGESSPEYRGPQDPPPAKAFEPLAEGDTVQALFLLTARPARARHLAAGAAGGLESLPGPGAGQALGPGERAFEPIPREGGYYLFTPKIGGDDAPADVVLPGLEVGDRFRARVRYDGILYVEEYEVLP
jgi:hypothetical protein